MKIKITAIVLSVLTLIALLAGCSVASSGIKAVVSKGDTVVLTSAQNAEDELKSAMVNGNTALFKKITVSENKGLFYNSYTFKATTNIAECDENYTVKVTMPGTVTQTKDGTAEDNTVTFTFQNFSQENEIAVSSDSNNYSVVIVIIVLLIVILGTFVYFTKKKE